MVSPEMPLFDISRAAYEAVERRMDSSSRSLIYSMLVLNGMEPPIKELCETVIRTVSDQEQKYLRLFGSALAYDLITEQLAMEGRKIEITDDDANTFYLDLMTKGGSEPLTTSQLLEFRQASLSRIRKGELPQLVADINWFIKIIRGRSPDFSNIIEHYAEGFSDSDSVVSGLGLDFIQGVLPPALIFYRKLGLLGQLGSDIGRG